MAKYYGTVGYVETVETSPSVYTETFVERNYYGDFTKIYRRLTASESINDNVTINNIISIVSDPYACENFCNIRYATWMGHKFKVDSVDVQPPRLILTLGGLFNG